MQQKLFIRSVRARISSRHFAYMGVIVVKESRQGAWGSEKPNIDRFFVEANRPPMFYSGKFYATTYVARPESFQSCTSPVQAEKNISRDWI